MSEARQRLPEGLESLPPGPELGVLLASVDRKALSDKHRVRLARARNRFAAHVQAELLADLYAVTWSEPPEDGLVRMEDDSVYPWAESEVAFALRWTHTAAGVRLDQARQLIEDLPRVWQALTAGQIDMPKALVFARQLVMLDVPVARRIVDKVIDAAPQLTTGQLRTRLARLVIAADPAAAATRAKTEVAGPAGGGVPGRQPSRHGDRVGVAAAAGRGRVGTADRDRKSS